MGHFRLKTGYFGFFFFFFLLDEMGMLGIYPVNYHHFNYGQLAKLGGFRWSSQIHYSIFSLSVHEFLFPFHLIHFVDFFLIFFPFCRSHKTSVCSTKSLLNNNESKPAARWTIEQILLLTMAIIFALLFLTLIILICIR